MNAFSKNIFDELPEIIRKINLAKQPDAKTSLPYLDIPNFGEVLLHDVIIRPSELPGILFHGAKKGSPVTLCVNLIQEDVGVVDGSWMSVKQIVDFEFVVRNKKDVLKTVYLLNRESAKEVMLRIESNAFFFAPSEKNIIKDIVFSEQLESSSPVLIADVTKQVVFNKENYKLENKMYLTATGSTGIKSVKLVVSENPQPLWVIQEIFQGNDMNLLSDSPLILAVDGVKNKGVLVKERGDNHGLKFVLLPHEFSGSRDHRELFLDDS